MSLDLSQLRNADGSGLTEEQIAALTAVPTTLPPATTPATPEPPLALGPSDAEKLVAVAQAGLDINSPLTSVIAQTFTGDLADPEAVRTYATTLGWVPPVAAPPAPTDTTGGQGGIRQALASGPGYVAPEEPPPADPYQVVRENVAQVKAEGFDEATQLMVGVQTLVGHAAAGDDRVSVAKHHDQGRLVRMTELGLVNTQG